MHKEKAKHNLNRRTDRCIMLDSSESMEA